jgi:hypothetical protein
MVMTKADDVAKKMPCSFPGETEVWTPDGLVPIGRLSVGDPVLARSEESGALAWRPVLQVGSRADASLLAVSLIAPWGDDERIEATPDHPFWRADGWVPVSELAPGDRVWGAPGGWLDVDDVQVLRHTNLVFNLEVDTDHNYFVGQLGAWVHNGPCDIPGGASKGATTPRAARREAMRDAGIPTSQQPTGQRSVTTHGPDGEVNVGRQLDYEVPAPGGGTQQMSVQHSLTDDVPGHGPHWEAGKVKDGGQVDSVGRPRLQNDKAKVDE